MLKCIAMWRHASLVVFFYLFSLSLASAAVSERVVIVSIDGLAAYELDDESLEIPNIRRLMAEGVRAESSETVYPSVTHPSHTTLVTGVLPNVHGVIGNRLVDRATGERYHITNKPHAESVRVPTIFDAAKARGLTTAAFYWPESWKDPAVDFNIPEVFDGEVADPTAADPAFLRELRDAGVPIDLYYDWYKDRALKGASDAILAQAAAYVLKRYRPHLLAIHFLTVDELQHAYGAEHPLAKAGVSAADHALGIVLDALEENGLREGTSVFLVADHGFHTVRHEVNLYPLFVQHGLADRVRLKPSGWALHVELTDAFDEARDGAALEALFAEAVTIPGIATVLRPEDFDRLGYPRYEADTRVPGQYAIFGDIDSFPIADASSSAIVRRPTGEAHHEHGYLPSHPRMYPAFVAAGAGMRRRARVGHVRNLDVAPTVAHLLGLELPSASGHVMTGILEDSPDGIADAYLEAIQRQDWGSMEALLAPDARYQDFTMEFFGRDAVDLEGRDAIVQFWRDSSESSGTSRIVYEPKSGFTVGPAVIRDVVARVTVSGAYWKSERPTVEASGRITMFLRVSNGQVTHHFDFVDYAEATRQIEAQR